MAWTPTSFKARWPVFNNTPDAVVQSALDESLRRHDERLFPTDLDDVVGLLAADLLSTDPFGVDNRLESDNGMTPFRVQWERIVKARAGGPWRIGQKPGQTL